MHVPCIIGMVSHNILGNMKASLFRKVNECFFKVLFTQGDSFRKTCMDEFLENGEKNDSHVMKRELCNCPNLHVSNHRRANVSLSLALSSVNQSLGINFRGIIQEVQIHTSLVSYPNVSASSDLPRTTLKYYSPFSSLLQVSSNKF